MPIGRSRKAKDTATCAHCGERFDVERRPGPYPRYCSAAHKQRAYEQRQRDEHADERELLLHELARLRRQLARAERENANLQRVLAEADAELARLRPVDPALAHLVRRDPAPAPPPSTPSRLRRRRR